MHRDLAGVLEAELIDEFLACALAEEVAFFPAGLTGVVTHVLDHVDRRHPEFIEHLDPLHHVDEAELLGRGNDHGGGQGDQLTQRELDVAGSGWEVDDKVVELAPVGSGEQLVDDLGRHGPAHDGRTRFAGVGWNPAERHQFNPLVHGGANQLVLAEELDAVRLDHGRHARSVDVGIENADAFAHCREGIGQVDRGGGLAHPAFTTGYGDDILDVLEAGRIGDKWVGHSSSRIPEHAENTHWEGVCKQMRRAFCAQHGPGRPRRFSPSVRDLQGVLTR